MMMSLHAIANTLQVDTHELPDLPISHISTDTRSLQEGDIFLALRGENFDGHAYLQQAIDKGAVAAIVSDVVDLAIPSLRVSDTRKAYGDIAAWYRRQFSIPIIAITGSSGKTSVKEMTASILRQAGNVLATQANYNNDIGVPLTLLQLREAHDFAVIEIGTNHPGEIAYSVNITQPTVAMVNNVGPAHIEFLGSVAGVAKEKSSIYTGLSADGTAVFNLDEAYVEPWRQKFKNLRQVTFSSQQEADIRGQLLTVDAMSRPSFRLSVAGKELTIQCPLPGLHNLQNALAACALTYAIGIDMECMKAGIEAMQSVKGRMQFKTGKAQATIIDDTYNANPASVKAAIDSLSVMPGKNILILGDLGELGEDAPMHLAAIGQYAAEKGLDALYSCGNLSAQASEAFGSAGQHFANQQALADHVLGLLDAEVNCLVKGSRAAGMEAIVDILCGGS